MSHEFSDGHFHEVIALSEWQQSWEAMSAKIPLLPRGWYELSQLSVEDRVEFTRVFWLSKLPILTPDESYCEERLETFFESLEDIEIFATQERANHPYEVHMVYALKEGAGYFHGAPPVTSASLEALKRQFAHVQLPPDYLAFLEIHDGFCKYTDTGMIKSKEMARAFQHLQKLLAEDILVRPDGQVIDPSSLIPFYESFGLHCYQCFYADWYPKSEMGNIYFSEPEHLISNFFEKHALEENLAFPTFVGWLVFYLEDVWH